MAENTPIVQRLNELIEFLGFSRKDFAERIGITPSNLSAILNEKRPCGSGIVNKIAVSFEQVNKDWLVSGIGQMIKENAQDVHSIVLSDDGSGVPVYDIDATCGVASRDFSLTNEMIIGSVNLPNVRRDCAIIRANGDSMFPVISDGNWIAVRQIMNFDDVFYGQIYLIITEEYRMIKYVRRYEPDEENFVILRSENPNYDDIKMKKSKILKVFIVENILAVKIQL